MDSVDFPGLYIPGLIRQHKVPGAIEELPLPAEILASGSHPRRFANIKIDIAWHIWRMHWSTGAQSSVPFLPTKKSLTVVVNVAIIQFFDAAQAMVNANHSLRRPTSG